MADLKISQMTPAATLDGTEIVPLVQTGDNVQADLTTLVNETIQAGPADVRTSLGLGTIATQNANNVSITGGAISGTTVAGYVPTSRTLTAGTGLSGGGDLSANRSFSISNTSVTAATYGSSTKIPVITFNAQGQATNASEITLSASSINAAYGSFYQNGHTNLTGAMTNNSTTAIQVTDTSDFATAGFLIIEQEIVQYTGKTSTTFTGITRGVKGTTNVSHDIGVAVSEAAGVTSSTSAAMTLDTEIVANGITVTLPDTKVYFDNTGVYNIQFSIQLLNYTETEDNVTVWFKKNNTDIDNSASVQYISGKHGTSPGATILALNYVDSFDANDYIELYWSSETGNTVLATYPPGSSPTRPASPSMILTVTQIG